jgi:hypothetical protein
MLMGEAPSQLYPKVLASQNLNSVSLNNQPFVVEVSYVASLWLLYLSLPIFSSIK